ncbi:MAG: TraB/GumN family protein [Steroidobacteraceae bacterium]
MTPEARLGIPVKSTLAPGKASRPIWKTAAAALLFLCTSLPAWSGGHHTFWVVHGRHNTIYVLGSIHVLKPSESKLPPEVLRAYTRAHALVMEVPLSDLSVGKLLSLTLNLGTLPQGKTLAEVLGPTLYADFSAHAKPLGLDPAYLSHFQPWLAALTVEQLELAKAGFDVNSGADMQLARRAQADHKPIIGLETAEDQLSLFARMSAAQQREFMQYALEDADDAPREVQTMVGAWRDGDTGALEKALHEGFDQFPALYQALTTDRNRKWLAEILPLLRDHQDYLIVVGALHLVGHDGVIELLERRGYAPIQH